MRAVDAILHEFELVLNRFCVIDKSVMHAVLGLELLLVPAQVVVRDIRIARVEFVTCLHLFHDRTEFTDRGKPTLVHQHAVLLKVIAPFHHKRVLTNRVGRLSADDFLDEILVACKNKVFHKINVKSRMS